MRKKTFAIGSLFLIVVAFSILQWRKIETNHEKDIESFYDLNNHEEYFIVDIDPETAGYKKGIQEGKFALYHQMAILGKITPELAKIINEEEKVYTSSEFEVVFEGEDEILFKESNDKGYVDGYHRAINEFYCPR